MFHVLRENGFSMRVKLENRLRTMGRTRAFLMLLISVGTLSFLWQDSFEEPAFILVIDAGHGGSDPGNLGTGRKKKTEKDISLDVALKFGEYVTKQFPDVKIVYTRKGDTFPTLSDRVKTANNAHADLFVSIHCNANDNTNAFGAETFVMGLHKSEESLKTAMRENASIYLEKDHEKNYEGFNPRDPDTYIILSMRENAFLGKSIDLADKVQEQFVKKVGRKDRGVKQAGYYVISFTNMPSILIELGFLTNAEEEDFLHSDDGKTHMASAIFRAFKSFYGNKEAIAAPVEPASRPTEKTESKGFNPQSISYRTISQGIRYQVQIVSSEVPLKSTDKVFKGIEKIDHYEYNGVFKYLAGSTASYKEAKAMQEVLKTAGFKDAFLVAFEDNRRIELGVAVQKTGKE